MTSSVTTRPALNKPTTTKRMVRKIIQAIKRTILTILFAQLTWGSVVAATSDLHSNTANQLKKQHFIYTPNDMLNFDLRAYLAQQMPTLSGYAESLQHWSAHSSVSPKILISLFQYQTGEPRLSSISPTMLQQALLPLSTQAKLSDQVRDISANLADHYYLALEQGAAHPENLALNAVLDANFNHSKKIARSSKSTQDQIETFTDGFFSLFPQQKTESPSSQHEKTPPTDSLLHLPYPIGQSWQTWGGTHSNSGKNNGPRSSLDFRLGRLGFGANTSNIWVASAINGRVVKHSSCFIEVIASNGWSTGYYHLDNIKVSSGQTVSRNTRLANYANNQPQSICQGGTSNGPHVHFSLKRNGAHFSLDQVALSGWVVNEGRRDYDTDCNHFYLESNGSRKCNGTPILNKGVGSVLARIPDLRASTPALSKTEVNPNERITLTSTIVNDGPGEASSTNFSFVISPNPTLAASDSLLGNESLKSLAAAESFSVSKQLIAPNKPGAYWLGVCVTPVRNEQNTSNNCSLGAALKVRRLNLVAPQLLLLSED